MVRKIVFTREDVVDAGLSVLKKDGLSGLSARRVADELGASTAPVYSNFANMDELGVAVKQAATDELLEYTTRDFTENGFLNIGIGVLEFARQNPTLYAAVFMQDSNQCEAGPRVMAKLSERMASMGDLGDLPEPERLMLLHQMGIFTHGLAVRICTGLAEHHSFNDLILFLSDAGEGMTRHALSRPERSAEQMTLMQSLIDLQSQEEAGDE
jgi:AcrR family transcriptional regulator